MRGALCLLAMACQGPDGPRSHYAFEVSGAVTARACGLADAGAVGSESDPYFSVSVGRLEDAAAVVLTRAGWKPQVRGVFQVGELPFSSGTGYGGLVVTGEPSHPTGVFRVHRGTLRITRAAADRLAGEFELKAHGYLTATPDEVARIVTARGRFITGTNDGGGCNP
jgi:hypothetical protein